MNIYSSTDIYEIDKNAENHGFSTFTLMENAGRNIAEALIELVDKKSSILILAGRGNNGGDGIVAARHLLAAGYSVILDFPLGGSKSKTALAHLEFFKAEGFTVTDKRAILEKPNIIIDALLGVGTRLPLKTDVIKVLKWANDQPCTRYAIDLPTGIHADTGEVEEQEAIFQADATFVLHGAKPSAFLVPANEFYGKVIHIPIGLKEESRIKQINKEAVRKTHPLRKPSSHKGTFGTSLLFAGSNDMPGSALLASIGAIRSGTGKLMVGTTQFVASLITPRVPEATYLFEELEETSSFKNSFEKINAVGIGPGLQNKTKIKRILKQLIETDIPLVIDAGALLPDIDWKREALTVLTPHPGEFSRLTGISVPNIQANRIKVAEDFALKHNVVLVLKGQHTIIALPHGEVWINPTGNTALAKGGSGDVLTGMITSMLSYYKNPYTAVINAVFLHGLCADLWRQQNSETAMTASDFETLLPKVFRHIETRLSDDESNDDFKVM